MIINTLLLTIYSCAGKSLDFFTCSSVSAHQLFISIEISGRAEEPALPKCRGRIQADEVTQLATTRLFQVAGQFIFPLNVLFRNSSLTHKSYLSQIFGGLQQSPSPAMLNDLWNNLIMTSPWQTDLSRRWSRVMDMSRAVLTAGKTVRALEESEESEDGVSGGRTTAKSA